MNKLKYFFSCTKWLKMTFLLVPVSWIVDIWIEGVTVINNLFIHIRKVIPEFLQNSEHNVDTEKYQFLNLNSINVGDKLQCNPLKL